MRKRETAPLRTTFWEDGLHVGTIVEYVDDTREGKGFCVWYTAGGGRHAPDFQTAKQELHDDLLR